MAAGIAIVLSALKSPPPVKGDVVEIVRDVGTKPAIAVPLSDRILLVINAMPILLY